jgi:hypothetical protein
VIARLSALATGTGNARRVLIGAGVLFLLAAAFGAPVTTILKSSNSDFQDRKAENQQVEKAIERATGQRAAYGVAGGGGGAGGVGASAAGRRGRKMRTKSPDQSTWLRAGFLLRTELFARPAPLRGA